MPWMRSRLAGPAELGDAPSDTLYTAPAASTYNTGKITVRKVHFYNADSVTRYITLSIGADAAGTRLLDAFPIPAFSAYDLWGPLNLSATEVIQGFADTANKVTYTIDGEIETY